MKIEKDHFLYRFRHWPGMKFSFPLELDWKVWKPLGFWKNRELCSGAWRQTKQPTRPWLALSMSVWKSRAFPTRWLAPRRHSRRPGNSFLLPSDWIVHKFCLSFWKTTSANSVISLWIRLWRSKTEKTGETVRSFFGCISVRFGKRDERRWAERAEAPPPLLARISRESWVFRLVSSQPPSHSTRKRQAQLEAGRDWPLWPSLKSFLIKKREITKMSSSRISRGLSGTAKNSVSMVQARVSFTHTANEITNSPFLSAEKSRKNTKLHTL